MTPIVVVVRGESCLLIAFDGGKGICVLEGGRISAFALDDIRVDRPTQEFPLGFRFSRVQVEQQP